MIGMVFRKGKEFRGVQKISEFLKQEISGAGILNFFQGLLRFLSFIKVIDFFPVLLIAGYAVPG